MTETTTETARKILEILDDSEEKLSKAIPLIKIYSENLKRGKY